MASTVVFRISNLGARTASTLQAIPFASADGPDVVVRCPQGSGTSVSEMIVWLYGGLKHQRRILKSLQADGAKLHCICKASRGDVVISPNASEFLHLTGTTLVISSDA